MPVRIVMSRSMHLPEDCNLWDVSSTPITVMTQRGARKDFQRRLEKKGVEIVEFDFLTPKGVMDYCYDRGFLSVLWECGGTLAAPAIASGIIHKVLLSRPLSIDVAFHPHILIHTYVVYHICILIHMHTYTCVTHILP